MNLGRFLAKTLEESGVSAREIGRRLGHSSNGLVTGVIKGKSPIPLAQLDEWTAALGLEGEAAAEFRRLALAEQAPQLAAEYEQLRQQVKAAGDTAAYVRAHACQIHAHEIGRHLPIADYAKKHNIPFNDLIQFNLTGEGDERTTLAMALLYDVPFAWLAGDGPDPDWYADLIVRCQGFGPAWRQEAARAIKAAP